MTRIAVIEDESDFGKIIYQQIQSTIGKTRKIKVACYLSAEAFLDQNDVYDILVSDIDLPGIDGIELGKIVRERYPETSIVYLTSYPEFATESYKLDAYQYILKSDMETRLPEVLNRLLDTITEDYKEYLWIGSSLDRKKIYDKDIVYISKRKGGKYVEFITVHGKYRERTTIEKIQHELPEEKFILIDRGCIVNLEHIDGIKEHVVHLEGNYCVEVSAKRLGKVKEKLHEYWRNI